MVWRTSLLVSLILAVSGCQHRSISLENLACKDGECVDGFVCHPQLGMCVPETKVGCGITGAICPADVQPGDACAEVGAFVPCTNAAADCSLGCYTCGADGNWGTCVGGPTCELATVDNCASCGDDCAAVVENAGALCNTSGVTPTCDYGDCTAGFVDLDGTRGNGCECGPIAAEVACNNVDEDCDGADAELTGTLTHCGSCADDCSTRVLHASSAACESNLCGYDTCENGFGDADGDRRNGCECTIANGGVERCDGIDDDCDGLVDDGLFACQCASGPASAETCDGVDNDCDGAVDDGFACHGVEARDCNAGGGPTSGVETCDPSRCIFSGICVPKDPTPPEAVADFAANAGDASVDATFTFPTDSDLAECVVLRKVGALPSDHTDGTTALQVVLPVPGADGELFDVGLTNGTVYGYAVFCRDVSNNWQEVVDAGTSALVTPLAVPPAIVANFAASDGEDGTTTLTFTMPTGAVSACSIYRKLGGYPAGHNDGAAVQVGASYTGSGDRTASQSGLTNGTTYYYAVFCRNDTTWNDAVDAVPAGVNADTAVPLDPAPLNPTDVSASDGGNASSSITFTMPSGPVSECLLRRKTGSYPTGHSDGTGVGGSLTGGAVVVPDSGLTNGTTYYYAVFCRNGTTWNDAVDSTPTEVNADTATPLDPAPSNPTDVSASDGGNAVATVTFTMPAGPVSDCTVFRSTGSYPATHTAPGATQVSTPRTGSGAKSVPDSGLVNGTTYYYAVFCRNGTSWNDTLDSTPTTVNADTATPLDPPPSNPTNVSASDGDDSASTITFTMPAAPVSECWVLRKVGGYPSEHDDAGALQVGASQTGAGAAKSVTDTGLSNGTTYYYAVFCRNGTTWNDAVDSTPTSVNAETGTPVDPPPNNPTNVSASDGNDGATTVSFTMPGAPVSDCTVFKKTGGYPSAHGDGAASQVGSPQTGAGTAKSVNDSGLTNGTTYYYAVFCRNGPSWNDTVDSVPANVNADTAQPLDSAPSNPTDVSASDGANSASTVTFTMPGAPVSECRLYRKTGNYPSDHGDGTQVGAAQTGSGGKSIPDSGLSNGTTYYYAVFCRNGTTWNDTVDSTPTSVNADTGTPACVGGTVALSANSLGCDAWAPGATGRGVMAFTATAATCPSSFTGVTVKSHASATTATSGIGNELVNAKLYLDANANGVVDAGDTQQGATAGFSVGAVTFSGLSVSLPVGSGVRFLLVTDVVAGAPLSYYAATIAATTDFTVSSGTRSLAATPLLGNAHAITGRVCSATDAGSGSHAATSVKSIMRPNIALVGWAQGTGDEVNWTTLTTDTVGRTADCDLASSADGATAYTNNLSVRDRGVRTQFLHIDTGVPLGLPLCGLSMRLYASDFIAAASNCNGLTWTAYRRLWMYSYDDTTTVDAASRDYSPAPAANLTPTAGPDTASPPAPQKCSTDYVDVDLIDLYKGASGTSTLEVRLIPEVQTSVTTPYTNNIDRDDNTRVDSVTEIYVRATP